MSRVYFREYEPKQPISWSKVKRSCIVFVQFFWTPMDWFFCLENTSTGQKPQFMTIFSLSRSYTNDILPVIRDTVDHHFGSWNIHWKLTVHFGLATGYRQNFSSSGCHSVQEVDIIKHHDAVIQQCPYAVRMRFRHMVKHLLYNIVGSAYSAVSTAVVGVRGVSLTLSILAISPAASGAAIVLDLVNINYITVNSVN